MLLNCVQDLTAHSPSWWDAANPCLSHSAAQGVITGHFSSLQIFSSPANLHTPEALLPCSVCFPGTSVAHVAAPQVSGIPLGVPHAMQNLRQPCHSELIVYTHTHTKNPTTTKKNPTTNQQNQGLKYRKGIPQKVKVVGS